MRVERDELTRRGSKYKSHRYADIWPMQTNEDIAALADSIKANGQLLTAWMYQGCVLDGRNRVLACERAGVEPTLKEFHGDDADALELVKAFNGDRRNMTEMQRYGAARRYEREVAKLIRTAKRQAAAPKLPGITDTTREMLDEFEEGATAELHAAVGEYDIPPAAAAMVAKMEPQAQRNVIELVRAERDREVEAYRAKSESVEIVSRAIVFTPAGVVEFRDGLRRLENSPSPTHRACAKWMRLMLPEACDG